MARQDSKKAQRGSKKKAASRSKPGLTAGRQAQTSPGQARKTKESLKRTIAVQHQKIVSKKPANVDLGPKKFTHGELEQFKKIILEKRRETVEELDTLKESMMDVTTGEYVSESSTYSLHMEQGTDAMEREKTFLFASRGSKFVNQLDDALTRIESGTYGVCRVCNLLIPKERLEAVPTAQTCAEYKNTNTPCERGRAALAKKR